MRLSRAPLIAVVAAFALGACGKHGGGSTDTVPPMDAAPVSPVAVAADGDAGACGPFECRLFDSPKDALLEATANAPLVVALGEAHAPRVVPGALDGGPAIASSAKRFTGDLLPLFKGRASDLLLELMLPPTGCHKTTESARTAQAPATESHADTDQSEYVAMGNAARPLGIVPDVLRPSCADLAAVADAGDDAIAASLVLIQRLAASQAKATLARPGRDPEQMLLIYGGALHNDPDPTRETAAWSYGPDVSRAVNGRYVAVDLFVPEYISADATWRAWPWFPAYERGRGRYPGKTWLFHTAPAVYVVIFAAAEPVDR